MIFSSLGSRRRPTLSQLPAKWVGANASSFEKQTNFDEKKQQMRIENLEHFLGLGMVRKFYFNSGQGAQTF